MTKQETRQTLKAIRCCRGDFCTQCPLQCEICDTFQVEMESLPADLVDRIEAELEEKLKVQDLVDKIATNMKKN